MSNEKLAFFIGLLGSLHCIGMCGPLAFAVPIRQKGWFYLFLNKLVYQLGRVLSYCLLGAIVGLLGKQIWEAGFQQSISILTGVLITTAALSRLLKLTVFKEITLRSVKPINRIFEYAFRHRANHLIIGMINGFLPCGFVYLALAGALNTESVPEGILYMFWFGAGTIPLMLAATMAAGFSGRFFRNRLNKLIPYAMLFLGVWFILRGLELEIPFLSPSLPVSQTTECR